MEFKDETEMKKIVSENKKLVSENRKLNIIIISFVVLALSFILLIFFSGTKKDLIIFSEKPVALYELEAIPELKDYNIEVINYAKYL